MQVRAVHHCHHIKDIDASLAFYEKALDMHETRRKVADDGSWQIIFVAAQDDSFEIELTWNKDFEGVYDNGSRDTHLAVRVDDIDAAHTLHEQMGCICSENPKMNLYFIEDPDGYWIEVLRLKK